MSKVTRGRDEGRPQHVCTVDSLLVSKLTHPVCAACVCTWHVCMYMCVEAGGCPPSIAHRLIFFGDRA